MTEFTTVHLTVMPGSKTISAKAGQSLLDALRQAGIEIAAPCDGQGLCGKCRVRIRHPAPSVDTPHPHLRLDEIASGTRLACEVTVQNGMVVTLPEDHALDTRILEGERIRRCPVSPAAMVTKNGTQFHVCYEDQPAVALSNWRDGFVPKGIAVDLGTTTLVVTLMDLQKGCELATASAVNPQTRFGHDVVSRIQHGSTPAGLNELANSIAGGLNGLIDQVCRASDTHHCEIVDAVIGGNTTMLQLAAAIDPAPLGRVPFTVGMVSGCTYPMEMFRLQINPCARVYIPPVAHAFVGADISAGLLSIDFFRRKGPVLFMDLGTNGEMALSANGQRIVTSTAAGPAFEGMGISQGMRAESGAIETVWTGGDYLSLRTIDDAPARGICGSGIMDVMAGLIRLGAVDASGRLHRPPSGKCLPAPLADRFEIIDGKAAIRLSGQVYFNQKDIRQFQLAKSAVQTGAEMMLAAAGLKAAQLEHIVVAGAFGYHLREESLRAIGILPGGFRGQIDFAGNTSRTGCAFLLADATNRHRLEKQMAQITHLAIAEKADFQSQFIKNLALENVR